MTIDAYINPDFTTGKKIIFFLLALAGVIICDILILLGVRFASLFTSKDEGPAVVNHRFHVVVQLFYEMIISAASVMFFACSYVILNHIYSLAEAGNAVYSGYMGTFLEVWRDWKDFILLLLICISCILNTLLDKLIIPLNRISRDEKAAIRMLAMFYAVIILLFLNMIGDESEYSPVMMYYLGLVVGRFVYFDASFLDFLTALKNVFFRLPLLVIGLALSGSLCYFGFQAGFLIERNYYIVGVMYTHLFLLAAVFLFRHLRILDLMFSDRGYKDRDDTDI
ncbi:MAG: hypothetical protein K5668_00210 [Lachnospiraceae bacterium]|nr:hypothetical protein [Lachnospiraceae bacterium]